MISIENKEGCCGCSACYSICPNNAIVMEEDELGFKYPKVDKEKCVNCNLCEKVCPILNQRIKETRPKAYLCINKNLDIRLNSSSGGVFSALAEEILNRDGIVFGATFDNNFEVIHTYIEKKDEISKLQGSKYVQSDIKKTYLEAKKYLEQDRYVLYTGTPCQIEGLQSFLGKGYNKLYTQDIICHGVPSRKVWRNYLNNITNNNIKNITGIRLRDKRNSWENYSIKINSNTKEYNKSHNKDAYMQAFIQNLDLRDSCYNCKFKKYNRNSDITLADFWGISKIDNSFNDHKGVSLVIINNDKGRELLEKIKKQCIIKEVDLDNAIKYNQSFIKSIEQNKNRNEFFKNFDSKNIKVLIKKYTYSQGLIRKLIRKCINKIK